MSECFDPREMIPNPPSLYCLPVVLAKLLRELDGNPGVLGIYSGGWVNILLDFRTSRYLILGSGRNIPPRSAWQRSLRIYFVCIFLPLSDEE